MSTIVFDSYTFIKRLKATGSTEEQAEVIVDASRDALGRLVTKDDLGRCQSSCRLNRHVYAAFLSSEMFSLRVQLSMTC